MKKKLFNDPKIISVLVGLFISFAACFLVAYRGTDDYESSYKTEQNHGGEYRSTRSAGVSLPQGIKRVLDVPVWDQTQGLGKRMPMLMYSQSQTPFIFLDRFLSIDLIMNLRLLVATVFALVLTNLCIASWGTFKLIYRLIYLDFSLLGVFFLYTVHNDWIVQAEQYWGLLLVIVGFFHSRFFESPTQDNKKFPNLSLYSILIGSGLLFFNHPTWYSLTLLSLPFFIFNRFTLTIFKISLIKTLALLIAIFFYPLSQIIELANQKVIKNLMSYSTQTSIFDFFANEPWKYRLQPILAPIAGATQPILSLFGKAGSRTEFFNFFLLAVLIIFLWSSDKQNSISKLLRRSLCALGLLLFCLLFSGVLGRSETFLISKLFVSHAWQYAHPMLIIILLSSTIIFGEKNYWHLKNKKLQKVTLVITSIGVLIAMMYPVVMAFKNVDNSKFALFQNSRLKTDIDTSLILIKNQRFTDLSTSANNSEEDWNALFGVRFDLQLTRAGYPSVEFFGAARQSSTLTENFEPYRSGYVPNVNDCESEVLDFLAVSSIFVNSDDTSGCQQKLTTYFGAETAQTIKKVAGDLGTAQLFRPNIFRTWSISESSENNPQESCPLFEKNCLVGLEVKDLPAVIGAPFKLCESDCLFTYDWAGSEITKQILVPANFDSTLEARDKKNGTKLKTANYQGLLAITVDGQTKAGAIEVAVKPDLMMWLRVATTYLHTAVFLGALAMMLRLGWRHLIFLNKSEN